MFGNVPSKLTWLITAWLLVTAASLDQTTTTASPIKETTFEETSGVAPPPTPEPVETPAPVDEKLELENDQLTKPTVILQQQDGDSEPTQQKDDDEPTLVNQQQGEDQSDAIRIQIHKLPPIQIGGDDTTVIVTKKGSSGAGDSGNYLDPSLPPPGLVMGPTSPPTSSGEEEEEVETALPVYKEDWFWGMLGVIFACLALGLGFREKIFCCKPDKKDERPRYSFPRGSAFPTLRPRGSPASASPTAPRPERGSLRPPSCFTPSQSPEPQCRSRSRLPESLPIPEHRPQFRARRSQSRRPQFRARRSQARRPQFLARRTKSKSPPPLSSLQPSGP